MRRLIPTLVLAGAVLIIPTAAFAQTPPTPTDTATPSPSPTNVPAIPDKQVCTGIPESAGLFSAPKYLVPRSDGQPGFELEDAMHACTMMGQQEAHDQAKAAMEGVLPDKTGSKYSMSSYDIGSSTGIAGTIFGIPTALIFEAAVWVVAAGLFVVTYAMGFPFEAVGGKIATSMSSVLMTRIIGPLNLGRFALAVLALAAVFFLARRRPGRAATEVATAVVALLLATFIVGNPAGILRSGFRIESELTGTFLSLSSPNPGPGNENTLDAVKRVVVENDVERPYYSVNWGSQLTGRCKAIAEEALSLGPWGQASAPRDTMMKAPECQGAARYNANASPLRLLTAVCVLLNALVSTVLLWLLGLVSLIAQLGSVGLLATGFAALICFIFPSPIRSLGFRWLEAAFRVLVVTVISSVILSAWALILTSVFEAMGDAPMWFRFLVEAACSGLSIYLFLSALKAAPRIARNMTKSAEGKEGWVPPRKSHGGAFGLGLGVGGLAEYEAIKGKLGRLGRFMPSGSARKISGQEDATLPGSAEHAALQAGRIPKSGFEVVDAPRGPGELSTTVYDPFGDGKWRPDAEHVRADRVSPRTDYWTSRAAMEEAERRLNGGPPERRGLPPGGRYGLPPSNPRKIVVEGPDERSPESVGGYPANGDVVRPRRTVNVLDVRARPEP